MKNVFLTAAAGAAAFALSSPAFAQCYAVYPGDTPMEPVADYDLLGMSEEPGLVAAPEMPEGTNALMCDRDTIVPGADDYEVLLHGVPLLIRSGPEDAARVVALDIAENQFRVRIMQGELSEDERAQAVARLEGFYERYAALQEAQQAGDAEEG